MPLVPGAAPSFVKSPRDNPGVLARLLDAVRVGPDADDAARRVPEQRRGRAPQDFDAIDFTELEVGELALAVGERLWDAVDEDLDAANGEC